MKEKLIEQIYSMIITTDQMNKYRDLYKEEKTIQALDYSYREVLKSFLRKIEVRFTHTDMINIKDIKKTAGFREEFADYLEKNWDLAATGHEKYEWIKGVVCGIVRRAKWIYPGELEETDCPSIELPVCYCLKASTDRRKIAKNITDNIYFFLNDQEKKLLKDGFVMNLGRRVPLEKNTNKFAGEPSWKFVEVDLFTPTGEAYYYNQKSPVKYVTGFISLYVRDGENLIKLKISNEMNPYENMDFIEEKVLINIKRQIRLVRVVLGDMVELFLDGREEPERILFDCFEEADIWARALIND